MKTLYIIGNGFDIAHNLPTSYWHFREYLEDMHQDFLADFEYLYNIDEIEYNVSRVDSVELDCDKIYDLIHNKI